MPSFDGLSGGGACRAIRRPAPAMTRRSPLATRVATDSDAANDASAEADSPNSDVADAVGEADTPFPLPPDAPALGLYFYWPFESGSTKIADDVSGNRRNGVLTNVLTSTDQAPTARPGNVRSVKFEDAQSSISCLADVPVESYTIAMWVKPASGSNKLVVSRVDTASNTLLMQLRITGTGVFEHYVNDGSSGAGCQQSEVGSCTTGTTVIKGGTWYHVAMTAKSRSEMHLYVERIRRGHVAKVDAVSEHR